MKKRILLPVIFYFVGCLCVSSAFAQYGTAEVSVNASKIEQLSADAGQPTQEVVVKEDVVTENVPLEEVVLPSATTVKAVDIQGNKTIGITTILAKIKTRVGDLYSENIVGDDIKRLYNTGYFSDVAVEKQDYEDGLKVIIHLKEKPVIDKITFSKTRYYSPRALTLKMKSKKGRFFDRRNLKEDKKIIKNLYEKKGLTKAVINVDVDIDEASNRAKIHFIIQEGERVKIKKIKVFGNKSFPYKKIIRAIKTRADTLFTSGYLKVDVLDEDMERIKAFYTSEGFLDATASYILEQAPKSRLIINIKIDEGKKYFVGNITIEGNNIVFSTDDILKVMTEIKKDGIFTPQKMDEDLASINSLYFDKGYIFVHVAESTSINPDTGKVDILLDLQEGDKAYVNKVNIQGNMRTRDIVIRRELRLKPGDVFDGAKLRRSKERLKNLGYFEEVDYDIQDTPYANKKDLLVKVREAKTGSFSFGGGYSTVEQLVGFVEVEQKNFDFTNWPTFTGGGQDILIRGEVGSVRNNARLSFTEPWIFDFPISGGFDLYRTKLSRDSDVGYAFDEKRVGGDIRFGKQISEYLSAGTIYRLEEITISNLADGVSSELTKEAGTNTISMSSFSLTYDTRDNVFSPTKGFILGGTVDLAGGFLSGDKDFYRFRTKTSYLVPVVKETVLEFRLRTGFAKAYDDSEYVPVYERFFAGGANTIRGYNERKVGPLDSITDDPIGGDSLLVANIEYTVPLMDFLKVAAFFDVGNVWKDVEDFATGGYKAGTGLGLRIKTPIGPINLDYGYPLNDEPGEDERSGKFYFSISRSF